MQVMKQISAAKVVVLGTGGTISGRSSLAADNVGYAVGEVGVGDLIAGLPGGWEDRMSLVAEQVAQIDSKDMAVDVWQRLAARCQYHLGQEDVRAVVVTHGTDTMEETAFFLDRVLSGEGAPSKPVILTGAMRPASSVAPDGPQNLLDAFAVATHPGASGVLVVMAGSVFAGVEVQKVHCYRVDAFDASDAGPLAYVEEGRVRMVRPWPDHDVGAGVRLTAYRHAVQWPRVEIVMSHAGAGAALVDALVAYAGPGVAALRGVVVAGTGNGTLHEGLEAALLRAHHEHGVAVVRSTRCSRGRVLASAKDVFPHSDGLSPVKARIAMMLGMMEEAMPVLPPLA